MDVNQTRITVKNDTTKPKAIIAVADTLNCVVNQIDLNGNASSKGARYLYNWVALSGNIVQGTNSLLPKIDQKGIYQLVVHDTLLGCKDSSTITVVQDIQQPIAKISVLKKVINCKGYRGADRWYNSCQQQRSEISMVQRHKR